MNESQHVPCHSSRSVDELDRIARNGSLNLFGQISYAVLQLAVVYLLARGLGKSGIGYYYAIVAAMLVIQLTVESGAGTLLTRRLVQTPDNWTTLSAEGLGLFIVMAMLSASIILVVGFGWTYCIEDPTLLVGFIGAALACAAIQLQRYANAVFLAWEIVWYENVAKILQGALFVASLLLLARWHTVSLESALLVLAVSHIMAGLYLLRRLARRQSLRWRFHFASLQHWLREALPLGLGDLVRKITWQADTMLLALLQPASVVGVYSIGHRPLGPLNWIPRAVFSAAFPSVARTARTTTVQLSNYLERGTRLMVVIGTPLAIVLCVFSNHLILFLAGPDFSESVLVFRILVWVVIVSFVSQQYRFLFAAINRQSTFARLALFALVAKLVIQIGLIPFWGYYGTCVGCLIGEGLFAITGWIVCHRMGLARFRWRRLASCVVAGIVMGGLVWIGRDLMLPLLTAWTAVAAILYFALIIVLSGVTDDELGQFMRVIGKGKAFVFSRTLQDARSH